MRYLERRMDTSRGIVSPSGRTWIDGEVTPNSAPAKEVCRAAAASTRRVVGGWSRLIIVSRYLTLLWLCVICFLAGEVCASTSQTPSFLGSYQNSTLLNYADGMAYDIDRGYVYVTSFWADAVTVVDVDSRKT